MQPESAIARLFASRHGLVTRDQARTRGLSDHRIDYLVKKRCWQPIHLGVYRLAGSPETWHQRLLAASLAAGHGALASHRSAAILYGLPAVGRPIELTIPKSRRIRTRNVIVHRSRDVDARDRRAIDAIPVTAPARTIIDLAAVVSPTHLEAVLDEALARRLISPQQILNRLRTLGSTGRMGTRTLRGLLEDRLSASRPSESKFEAALRRILRRNGIPLPVPQFRVRLPSGRIARVDFAYPEALRAVEADSYRYHSSLSAWSRDRVRHNELLEMGWRVLPITFADLRADPRGVADQVGRCLGAISVGSTGIT
jgi:very-short-patch-repair endonuclease